MLTTLKMGLNEPSPSARDKRAPRQEGIEKPAPDSRQASDQDLPTPPNEPDTLSHKEDQTKPSKPPRFRRTSQHPILNLALQGGGAHGAFTWGVLDYLLEQGYSRFEGVSGTSAGAMNGVALAQGLMTGGAEGARETLQHFWESVAANAPINYRVSQGTSGPMPGMGTAMSFMNGLTRYFSPYQLNPLDLNPLRAIVERIFDFERLQHESPVKLFISATHATNGQLRVFQNRELTSSMLLASACLPTMAHTVEIEGEPYWDGGYSANPALFPIYTHCATQDLLLILLSPTDFGPVPKSADGIRTRATEISFNSAFLREMHAIAAARSYAEKSWLKLGRLERRLTRLRFHQLDPTDYFQGLSSESKLVADKRFLERLKLQGRERAQLWLAEQGAKLGKESSMDMRPYLE